MIKTFALFILMTFICNATIAQSVEKVDSLKIELANAKHDTIRVIVLQQLCASFRYSNIDSAIYYGEKAYSLATDINFYKGQVVALGFEAFAFVNYGDLSKALEVSFRALQIAKDKDLKSFTGPALRNIGTIYQLLKDYPKALHYFQVQLAVEMSKGYACSHLGSLFLDMNQLDSASYYADLALHNFGMEDDAEIFRILGDIALKKGNFPLAFSYFQKGLQNSLTRNETSWTADLYNRLSIYYQETNKPDSSIFYAKKGLQTAKLHSTKGAMLESATLLSKFYEPLDSKESLRYYKMATSIKDNLFGAGNIQAVQTMITREEERQKEFEAAKQENLNRIRSYAMLGSIFTLRVIAFFLFRNSRLKQKAKKNIELAYDQLKATQAQLIQSEKMASLGELTAGIAHEIQNPLNFVNNFSEVSSEMLDEMDEELNKGEIEEAKAISADLKQNLEKINHHGNRASSIVKGMLEHSRTSSGKKELTDINALADEYLRLAYHGLRAKDKSFNADFETNFDSTLPKIEIIPHDIGRVLLNLINNAFQAVDEQAKRGIKGYKPTVSLKTELKANASMLIAITDNGPGIPDSIKDKVFQPFFTTKDTGKGTGLGLSLAYDIVKAHGGELTVKSKENDATNFIVTYL